MGTWLRGPHRSSISNDRGPHQDAVRGRTVRVRRATRRRVPARAATVPLPLVLHRPTQPQPIRGRQGQSVRQADTHIDRYIDICTHIYTI